LAGYHAGTQHAASEAGTFFFDHGNDFERVLRFEAIIPEQSDYFESGDDASRAIERASIRNTVKM